MGMKQLLISLSPFASPLSLLAVNEALPLSALQHQREAENLVATPSPLASVVPLHLQMNISHFITQKDTQPSPVRLVLEDSSVQNFCYLLTIL